MDICHRNNNANIDASKQNLLNVGSLASNFTKESRFTVDVGSCLLLLIFTGFYFMEVAFHFKNEEPIDLSGICNF